MDLELRRMALEATGWTFEPTEPKRIAKFNEGQVTARKDGTLRVNGCDIERILTVLPAVESDPGVSEPWFLEWCEKKGFDWVVMLERFDNGGRFVCQLFKWKDGKSYPQHQVEEFGATPSEARAKAVIAATAKNPRAGKED